MTEKGKITYLILFVLLQLAIILPLVCQVVLLLLAVFPRFLVFLEYNIRQDLRRALLNQHHKNRSALLCIRAMDRTFTTTTVDTTECIENIATLWLIQQTYKSTAVKLKPCIIIVNFIIIIIIVIINFFKVGVVYSTRLINANHYRYKRCVWL